MLRENNDKTRANENISFYILTQGLQLHCLEVCFFMLFLMTETIEFITAFSTAFITSVDSFMCLQMI